MVASTVITHGEPKREKVSVNSMLLFLELPQRGSEQRGREGFCACVNGWSVMHGGF